MPPVTLFASFGGPGLLAVLVGLVSVLLALGVAYWLYRNTADDETDTAGP